MKFFAQSTNSKRDISSSIREDLRTRIAATTMVVLAIISSFYFVSCMADLHEDENIRLIDAVSDGATGGDDLATAVVVSLEYREMQVVREITLGYLIDTESGVTVRNLNTDEMTRMTEPGVRLGGIDGDTYAYTIEERNDGGQDLLVSLRANSNDNFLISYQIVEAATGSKQTANVTVVGGLVSAYLVYDNSELTASR